MEKTANLNLPPVSHFVLNRTILILVISCLSEEGALPPKYYQNNFNFFCLVCEYFNVFTIRAATTKTQSATITQITTGTTTITSS